MRFKSASLHGALVIFLIRDGINSGLVDDLTLAVEQEDVIMLKVKLTKGPDTKEGIENIEDSSMQNMVFATIEETIAWLNEVFNTQHEIESKWNLSSDSDNRPYVNFTNMEGFAAVEIEWDRGGFSVGFDLGFD